MLSFPHRLGGAFFLLYSLMFMLCPLIHCGNILLGKGVNELNANSVMEVFNLLYAKIYGEIDHLMADREIVDRLLDNVTNIKYEVLEHALYTFKNDPDMVAAISEELAER